MPRICDQCSTCHSAHSCPECGCIDYSTYMPSQEAILAMTLEIQRTWTKVEEANRARGSGVVRVKPMQAQVDAFKYGRITRLTVRDK